MVKDIVVFVRPHGLIIHADGNSQPNYFVDGRKLDIPTQDRLITTSFEPFHYKSLPLNQLERYQTNSLYVKNLVTIVGGYHPRFEVFF